jgi:antirestriction protein ArdC
MLGMSPKAFLTGDSRWVTYLQAEEKGRQVRRGERSMTIFFAKPLTVADEKAEEGTKTVHVLKRFAVFHASQVDGIPPYVPPTVEEAPWRRPECALVVAYGSVRRLVSRITRISEACSGSKFER